MVAVKRMHNGSVKGHHRVVAQSGVPENQSPPNRDCICPFAIRPTPLRLRYLRPSCPLRSASGISGTRRLDTALGHQGTAQVHHNVMKHSVVAL